MPATPQADQQLMTPEEAYDVLVAQVHAPVFFDKLARAYNVVPQDRAEAHDLLQMAGELRNVHEAEATKVASAGSGQVAAAKRDLDSVLANYGYASVTQSGPAVKQRAWNMAGNPLVKEAAVVFQHYLSQRQQ